MVARNAGADRTKETEGVDTGVVGVAPQELNRVITNRHVVDCPDVLWNLVWNKARPPGEFVNAVGAGALKPQESVRVWAAMPVIPQNYDCGFADFYFVG